MTDIFEKSSLVFAKRRVVQLMLGTTRRMPMRQTRHSRLCLELEDWLQELPQHVT